MCLVARHFESLGLPTLILGSALDILMAGKPPRAKFLNYPLGFESGRFKDKADQLKVVKNALQGFEEINSPSIVSIDAEWHEGWDTVNERERGTDDTRPPRTNQPQYQNEADKEAAEAN